MQSRSPNFSTLIRRKATRAGIEISSRAAETPHNPEGMENCFRLEGLEAKAKSTGEAIQSCASALIVPFLQRHFFRFVMGPFVLARLCASLPFQDTAQPPDRIFNHRFEQVTLRRGLHDRGSTVLDVKLASQPGGNDHLPLGSEPNGGWLLFRRLVSKPYVFYNSVKLCGVRSFRKTKTPPDSSGGVFWNARLCERGISSGSALTCVALRPARRDTPIAFSSIS